MPVTPVRILMLGYGPRTSDPEQIVYMNSNGQAATTRLHLDLASVADNIETVVDEAQAFVEAHHIDEELAYRVVLLASEAVTNAMKHGNKFKSSKRVVFDLVVMPDEVKIVVEDEGEGFVRDAVADPLATNNLMRDSGRGLFLMEELADEVRYELGGRRLCLRLDRST